MLANNELKSLPIEIFIEILSYLNGLNLGRASGVSKSWHIIIHDFANVLQTPHLKSHIHNLFAKHAYNHQVTVATDDIDKLLLMANELSERTKTSKRLLRIGTATIKRHFTFNNLAQIFLQSIISIINAYKEQYRPIWGRLYSPQGVLIGILGIWLTLGSLLYLIKKGLGDTPDFLSELADVPSITLQTFKKPMMVVFLFSLTIAFLIEFQKHYRTAQANYQQQLINTEQQVSEKVESNKKISFQDTTELLTISWRRNDIFNTQNSVQSEQMLPASNIEVAQLLNR